MRFILKTISAVVKTYLCCDLMIILYICLVGLIKGPEELQHYKTCLSDVNNKGADQPAHLGGGGQGGEGAGVLLY